MVDVRHVETIVKSLKEIEILEHKRICTNACCHAFDFHSVTANKNMKKLWYCFSIGSRSTLDRFSIVLRSSSVHPPLNNRRTIEDRTKDERRNIERASKSYRRFIEYLTKRYRRNIFFSIFEIFCDNNGQ